MARLLTLSAPRRAADDRAPARIIPTFLPNRTGGLRWRDSLVHFRQTIMNFDTAVVTFPNGDVRRLDPPQFYAIPLGERIELMVASRIKFEKDNQPISPLDALKKK